MLKPTTNSSHNLKKPTPATDPPSQSVTINARTHPQLIRSVKPSHRSSKTHEKILFTIRETKKKKKKSKEGSEIIEAVTAWVGGVLQIGDMQFKSRPWLVRGKERERGRKRRGREMPRGGRQRDGGQTKYSGALSLSLSLRLAEL